MWKASCSNNHQVVIKHQESEDRPGEKWAAFRKEIEMQSLFRSVKYIRRMIDIIPPSSDLEPPMMVLEPFEKTLWSARTKRPFTLREVKHIMKFALLGLQEIHEKGLVHCGRSIKEQS